MFKSFFKAFILIIGIMFANMSFADTTSDVFSSTSCAGLKNTFLEIANDKTTDNLQFSYKEALKCNIEVLPKSIIVKLFYMVFGDFSLDTMDIAVSIIQPILGLDIDFKDEAKAGMNGITVIEMFSTIITSITKIIGMAAALLVGSTYVMYLVSSAQDGEVLGKAYNTLWTSLRTIFVIMLLLPLESLDNYSSVQAISIMAAVVGTILANLIWFLMPVFEYLHTYNTSDIKANNEFSQKSTVSEFVNMNVKMHMCDIQARKQVYTYGKSVEDLTKDKLEGSKFSQCISNKGSPNIIKINDNSEKIIPTEISLTRSCAANPANENKYNIDCGYITLESKTGGIDSSEISDKYQSEIRKIAYDVIGRYCIDNQGDRKDGDREGLIKECADINSGTSLKYESYGGSQVLAVYGDAPSESDIQSAAKQIKDGIYNDLSKAGDSIIKSQITDDEVSLKISQSLIKGWLAASSFIIEIGSSLKDRDVLYNAAFSQLAIKNAAVISSSNNTLLGSSTLTNKFKTDLSGLNDYSDSVLSSSNYLPLFTTTTNDGEENSTSDYISSLFFPGLDYIKKFSIESSGSGVGGLKENSCLQDFSKCPTSSLNVVTDLIVLGNKMTTNGVVGALSTKVLAYLLTKFTEKDLVERPAGSEGQDMGTLKPGINVLVNALNFLSSLFSFYILFGVLITHMPAIIIFVFFVGNAVGWFIVVIQFVVSSQLWLLMHLMPGRGVQGFAGKAKKGYVMLLDIMIRPSFIVFGAFSTFIIMSAMVAMYSVMFGMVMSTFAFFRTPGSLYEFFANYVIHLIYLVLLLVVLYRSCKSIYKIPNALQNWLNIEVYGDASAWNNIVQKFKEITMTNVKNIVNVSGLIR
jgi:conjugal transfer/type IV secretion protein DotA/TraY